MEAAAMTQGKVFLDWQVHDAELRFASSPPEYRLSRARSLVRAKFARGDYEVLQALDDATLEVLASALVEAISAPSTPESGGAGVPPHT
jgi:hypothetical protein